MDKAELLQALHKSFKEATNREADYKQYRAISNTIESERAEAQKVPIMVRIKNAIVPIIVFIVAGSILDTTAMPTTQFSQLGGISKIFALITIVSLILAIVLMKKADKVYYKSEAYNNKMSELDQRSQALEEDLGVKIGMSYLKSQSYLSGLTDAYHNTFTLGKLITYLENSMADTLKEALSLYEDDCHRMRMEDAQNRILQEAEQQTQILNQMANDYYYYKYKY